MSVPLINSTTLLPLKPVHVSNVALQAGSVTQVADGRVGVAMTGGADFRWEMATEDAVIMRNITQRKH